MKKVFILMMCLFELYAVDTMALNGEWSSVAQTNNRGTLTLEKEFLTLKSDSTFKVVLLVSVQKGDAFIKDLRIEGTGIWKVWKETLVVVVKDVNVPQAREVYRISQSSLRQLAETFKNRFVNEPIRINTIIYYDNGHLTLKNERGKVTEYKR